MDTAVLIPIKAFHHAKARLSGAVSPHDRERLARWTAARVLAAAGELPVHVACDDETVAEWAVERGATVQWTPGNGLNAAVNDSIAALAIAGHRHVIIAHADLARPDPLPTIAIAGTVVLVPDRRLDGTNAMSMPTDCGFEVAYGPGSFRRHLAAAWALRVPVAVRRDAMLSLDIDTPTDLWHPMVQEVLPEWLQTNPVNRS